MVGEFQLPRLKRPRPVPKGLEAGLERMAGAWQRWQARRVGLGNEANVIRDRVLGFEGQRNAHLDEALRRAREGWARRRRGGLEERTAALAAIGAVAMRELGLVPHREQLMGVLGLQRGWMVEMATGEGKTLTLAMAAVLAAWRGEPCHILTANDYLAGRDTRGLARFYARCGVVVAAVTGGLKPAARTRSYRAGVVYTTSRELVGDFLRDRLRLGRRVTPETWRPWVRRRGGGRPNVTLPRLHTVLVDEADQVLIDDAVTPLIISIPRDNEYLVSMGAAALAEARELREGVDYSLVVAKRTVCIDKSVTVGFADEGGHPLLRVPRWREEWLGKALLALHTYEAGKHYAVQEGKIVLIDESTGRSMPDRNLGEGMQNLLEAKEGLEISRLTETVASLSFQRFFRQVPRLAGLTGTATDAAKEFWNLYRLPVVTIPTNRPSQRRVHRERGFRDEASKWKYIVHVANTARARGQPVLIGTRTVATSEAVADCLLAAGISHRLLNAVRNGDEAEVIAAAGRQGQITIATNMAGRGTDIVPSDEALSAGGLRVIATERHGSRRVDRQLFGRSARQGERGEVEPLACWEDEVLKHFLPQWWRRCGRSILGNGWFLRLSLSLAQWRAGRRAAAMRMGVLSHDQWLDQNLSLGAAGGRKRVKG
jgi:preprotein translocase subunit SecA